MPPHRVGFLGRFDLKTGIHFAYFALESGMVFVGTAECLKVFIISIPNDKERKKNREFEMDLNNFCVCTLIKIMIT